MEQTRGGAEELANRMREQTAEEIRKILTDLEVARASAEDELEAQRLLTEAARMRVRSSKFETDSFDDFKQQAAQNSSYEQMEYPSFHSGLFFLTALHFRLDADTQLSLTSNSDNRPLSNANGNQRHSLLRALGC